MLFYRKVQTCRDFNNGPTAEARQPVVDILRIVNGRKSDER